MKKAPTTLTQKTLHIKQLELEASKIIAESYGKSLKWQQNNDYRDTHSLGASYDLLISQIGDEWSPEYQEFDSDKSKEQHAEESTQKYTDWLFITSQSVYNAAEIDEKKLTSEEYYEALRDLFTNSERKFLASLAGSSRQVMQALGNSSGKYSRQRERQIIQMMIQKVEKAKSYCRNRHQLLTVAMEYLAKYDVRGNLIELSQLIVPSVSTTQRKLT